MDFRIADTFTGSLARLTSEEQKLAKTKAFDFQMEPAQPGKQFHRIDGAKDKNFWSVRVSRDLRLIVHKTASSLLLCYVGHHDAAYQWAERRRLEQHPTTGAAQLVEIRETVREIEIPKYVEVDAPSEAIAASAPKIFANTPDDELLNYGVPMDWLADVKQATEDSLLDLADHLPAEAAEALLELATGGTPQRMLPAAKHTDPFAHPDAQRRFRMMTNMEELERALEYPWDKWTVFLHPAQRQTVERDYSGPARIAGSAGTGKTIVALHRAVYLARAHPEARVLLATFSETLADALQTRLRRLVGNEPKIAERLEVHSMSKIAWRLYKANFEPPNLATEIQVREVLERSAAETEGHKFSSQFLWTEWSKVVDAWQLENWEEYRDVTRLGRKTRLAEKSRAILWTIFSRVREWLEEQKLLTEAGLLRRLEHHLSKAKHPPFEFCIIDEAQDIGIAELRLLAVFGGKRRNSLFFAGDLGQRIFQTPFSWKALGVDVRGRSHTLRINYRTSHQIRRQADCLLPAELTDVDGIAEWRGDTVSVFNGAEPQLRSFASADEEVTSHCRLAPPATEGWVRRARNRSIRALRNRDGESQEGHSRRRNVGHRTERTLGEASGSIVTGTMHLAKGLEFRAVVVMAVMMKYCHCNRGIENVADEADLQDTYDTERHLLYVACTRARDYLLVTGVEPASEFLDDLRMG